MREKFQTTGFNPGDTFYNHQNEIVPIQSLPPLLRVLLVTDGTVTKILEAYFWEQVKVESLSQAVIEIDQAFPHLNAAVGSSLLARSVLLKGQETKQFYAYAESHIRLEYLPGDLREALVAGQIGIGELLRESALETYRDLIEVGQCSNAEIARKLGILKGDEILYRTYKIELSHKPAIQITEYFPILRYPFCPEVKT